MYLSNLLKLTEMVILVKIKMTKSWPRYNFQLVLLCVLSDDDLYHYTTTWAIHIALTYKDNNLIKDIFSLDRLYLFLGMVYVYWPICLYKFSRCPIDRNIENKNKKLIEYQKVDKSGFYNC